jgi:glucan phosphoethanolaminetransferase (alkaline phosphatase superfamily)
MQGAAPSGPLDNLASLPQSTKIALLVGTLIAAGPTAMYVLFRKKRWIDAALAALVFLVSISPILSKGFGPAPLERYIAAQAMFCGLFPAVFLISWANQRLAARIALHAPLKMSAWSAIVLLVFAAGTYLIYALFLNPQLLSGVVQHFLNLSKGLGYHLTRSATTLCVGLAIVATVVNLLQAWFRRRQAAGKRPVPWFVTLAAIPGIVLVVLGVSYTTVNHFSEGGENGGLPPSCSKDGCAEI